jgi:hypothetical protein
MRTIHHVRPVVAVFLTTLIICLGAAALAGAAPANAGPPAGPSAGPPDPAPDLLALLAVQQAQLTASDGAASDWFGNSVAISGNTAVVGNPQHDVGGYADQGVAEVFTRSGTTWSHQWWLIASDGEASDLLGCSVALVGDTAVVGAPCDDAGIVTNQGSAYVFVRSGTTWSEQQKLVASDGNASDFFGYSVALSGETAVVGARWDDVEINPQQGSAYIFVRSGTTWSEQQKLTADDGDDDDDFGWSVAISGGTALVGAYHDDVSGNTDQGSAYVFLRDGTTWSQQAHLTATDGAASDNFGQSVALSGGTAVVGAHADDVGANTDQGSAYVFTRSGTNWSEQQKLVASDGASDDWFGVSVTLVGDSAIVGAPSDDVDSVLGQGSAYVFARSGTTWSQQAQLNSSDGAAGDQFGYSVALSGASALVGARYDDVGANADQGSAYVFTGVVEKPGKPVAKSPKGLISSRTPTFKWTAAARATSYEVCIYKGSKLIKKKTGITKLSWKCTKRLPRGVYLSWKVRARNAAGWGPWSAKPRFKVR